jgi:phosphoesterase RecJ-like protein
MNNQPTFRQVAETLNHSRRVFVASHAEPDGDAIGSLVAMGLALEAARKTVTFYNQTATPAVYRFLPAVERISADPAACRDCDVAVIIDCGNLERIGRAAQLVRQLPMVINIDHHVTNTRFGDLQLVDSGASSSAEVVYRLIKAMGLAIDPPMARALYTGILTDTGSFRFSNTNRAAFTICDHLVEIGVNPADVARHVYGHFSMGRIRLLNMALDSIEISHNGKVSLMSLTEEMLRQTGTQSEDIDGLINYARRIKDVKMAALIQEFSNGNGPASHHHVSLRSDGSVDVAAIAAAYGGGGHATAAGFNVDASMAEIKAKIMALAEHL